MFGLLYITLGIVDFVLMRRYASVDPPQMATATGWAASWARGFGPATGAMRWGSRSSGSS